MNARLFHRPAVSPARLERASPPLQGGIVAARPQGENVAARIRTSGSIASLAATRLEH